MVTNRNRIVASAQRFLQKAQYDRALAEYRRLLEDDPKDVRTLLKVGDVYVKMGDNAAAADTFIQIATRYHEGGSVHKAIAVFKQVLKLVPGRIEALYSLSELYVEIGLIAEAATGFTELAKAYDAEGRTKEMCAIYRRVVELEPENIAGRVRLAEMFVREELREEAILEFRAILDRLRKAHRRADFIKVAERLLYYEPADIAILKELASLYVDKGDATRALGRLQQAFRLAPRDPEVLELLADTFRDLGQHTKTAAVLRELASVHADSGRLAERDAALRRLLEVEPGDDEARQQLQSSVGARDGKSVDTEPGAPSVAAGEFDGASSDSFAAARAPESGVEKRLTEIEIYAKYGLREQAVREGEALAKAFPREERFARLLARIYKESGAVSLAAEALARYGEAMGEALGASTRALAEEVLDLDETCHWAVEALARQDEVAQTRGLGGSSPGIEIEVDEASLVLDVEAPGGTALAGASESAVAIDTDIDEKEGDFEFVAANDRAGVADPSRRAASQAPNLDEDDRDDGLIPVEAPDGRRYAVPLNDAMRIDTGLAVSPAAPPKTRFAATTSSEASVVLEEVDFFLLQGLREEALWTLRDAILRLPNDLALSLKLREFEMVHGHTFDEPTVGELVAQVADGVSGSGDAAVSLGDLISDLSLPSDDLVVAQSADTYFDLGKAYQDMALWDEAIEEYRRAIREPRLAADAGTALSLCLRQAGRHSEALREIDSVLESASLTISEKRAAIFERAAVFEAMGDMKAALNGYRSVAHEDPTYRDVGARIHRLATMLSKLGAVESGAVSGEPKARG